MSTIIVISNLDAKMESRIIAQVCASIKCTDGNCDTPSGVVCKDGVCTLPAGITSACADGSCNPCTCGSDHTVPVEVSEK